MMNYQQTIQDMREQPEELEKLYQEVHKVQETNQFKQAIDANFVESPQNLLFAAWHYRLQYLAQHLQAERSGVNWILVLPLSLLCGLALWLISDMNALFLDHMPYVIQFWSPLVALFVLAFFALAVRAEYGRFLAAAVGIALAGGYVWLLAPRLVEPDHYLELMAFHLPLLAWGSVGIGVIGLWAGYRSRFAFLSKSVEVFVTGGVFAIVLVMFFGLTMTMFQVLNVQIDELYQRLLIFGIGGTIPLLAVATVYDPLRKPAEQQFNSGLGRVIATMMRLLLPLTVVILIIYVAAIPFNFGEAFENREALIVYNVMQFAVLGLLLGATPFWKAELDERLQSWLRIGAILLTFLALLVSLYALAAIVWRTQQGGITINRMAFIGWNIINIGAFGLLLFRQWRYGRSRWLAGLQSTFSVTAVAYVVWALFMLLSVPWLFS